MKLNNLEHINLNWIVPPLQDIPPLPKKKERKKKEKKKKEKKYASMYYIRFTPRGHWMAAMMSKRRPRHHGHHRPQFRPLIRANSKLSTIVIIDILKLAPIKVSDKLVSLTTSKVINILNWKARVRTLMLMYTRKICKIEYNMNISKRTFWILKVNVLYKNF